MNDRHKVLDLRATMAQQQDLIDALENAQEMLERENTELKAKIAELQNDVLAQSIADLIRKNSGLAAQVEQLLTHLEDSHSTLGFLSAHLRGRMGEAALLDMAEKADYWREFCEQIRQQAKK